jgi:hypothetical protein
MGEPRNSKFLGVGKPKSLNRITKRIPVPEGNET